MAMCLSKYNWRGHRWETQFLSSHCHNALWQWRLRGDSVCLPCIILMAGEKQASDNTAHVFLLAGTTAVFHIGSRQILTEENL